MISILFVEVFSLDFSAKNEKQNVIDIRQACFLISDSTPTDGSNARKQVKVRYKENKSESDTKTTNYKPVT